VYADELPSRAQAASPPSSASAGVDDQDLCLHLVIQGEQSEIGRNGGSRSPAKPGDLGLGIDFAGIKEGLVLKGLL
jgi:hypothetical protein